MKQFLEMGKITSTHGIKGELKVYPWSDSAEDLLEFDFFYLDENGKDKIQVKSGRIQKNQVIIKFINIDDMNTAEKYKGKILYANRDDFILSENTYFIQDLIGLKVYDIDSDEFYGCIDEITQHGNNDVYYIKNNEKTVLIPAIADVVISTDIENKIMKIRPLKGLF